MAKPALKQKQGEIVIASREDADNVLSLVSEILEKIADEEAIADQAIREIRTALVDGTEDLRVSLGAYEDALEAWAKTDRKTWAEKHIELNFGTVGFRLPKPAIKLKAAVETIIERLRAKKMQTCIRTIEEVDKKALANYDDETLADIGCKRTKPKDKFYYEVKKEEVK
jgi:phage host-nuclease inhibitor protein Gam